MKHFLSYFLLLSGLMVLTPVYAGTQTLTTYYPAPQGDYNNMTVNTALTANNVTVGSSTTPGSVTVTGTEVVNGALTAQGTLIATEGLTLSANTVGNAPCGYVAGGGGPSLVTSNGQMDICNSGVLSPLNSWTSGSGATPFVYPSQNNGTNPNVDIGSTGDLGYNLGVTGTFGVTGNTVLGTSGGGNTTTIYGNTTVTGTTNLNGVTTIGGPTNGASIQANGATIYICPTGSGSCKPLEVTTGSDGNYYAVYAP